jgi:hypothetical protein
MKSYIIDIEKSSINNWETINGGQVQRKYEKSAKSFILDMNEPN